MCGDGIPPGRSLRRRQHHRGRRLLVRLPTSTRAIRASRRQALPPRCALWRRRDGAARALRRRQHQGGRWLFRRPARSSLGSSAAAAPASARPPSAATSVVEGAESCDDGNTLPFDGCSAIARASPTARRQRRLRLELWRRRRRRRGLRRRQQRRRRRLLADLQDRARLHVRPAAAGRQDAGAGRLSRFPISHAADFEPRRDRATTALTGMVQSTLDAHGKPVYHRARTATHITRRRPSRSGIATRPA